MASAMLGKPWRWIASAALCSIAALGKQNSVSALIVAWPSLPSDVDLSSGCGSVFSEAKTAMQGCLSGVWLRANSSAGIEESEYNMVCGCHATFKQSTETCVDDDDDIGPIISAFETYSPTRCTCPYAACNARGGHASTEDVPEEDIVKGHTKPLEMFAFATFTCWCCCCALAILFHFMKASGGRVACEDSDEDARSFKSKATSSRHSNSEEEEEEEEVSDEEMQQK